MNELGTSGEQIDSFWESNLDWIFAEKFSHAIIEFMHGALNHEDQTQVEHEQQAESVEDVEETGCPEDVKKHIDFRWDFNSCVIGQLGEAQSQCSIIPIATKLAHGCTHGKHHHYNWHELKHQVNTT